MPCAAVISVGEIFKKLKSRSNLSVFAPALLLKVDHYFTMTFNKMQALKYIYQTHVKINSQCMLPNLRIPPLGNNFDCL